MPRLRFAFPVIFISVTKRPFGDFLFFLATLVLRTSGDFSPFWALLGTVPFGGLSFFGFLSKIDPTASCGPLWGFLFELLLASGILLQ